MSASINSKTRNDSITIFVLLTREVILYPSELNSGDSGTRKVKVLISDGNSKHVAHTCRKTDIFEEKSDL